MALNCDIEVACVVQWGVLWFSYPTRLDHIFRQRHKKSRNTTKLKTWDLRLRSRCPSGVAHTENVHLKISECGTVQITRERLGRKQGDIGMATGEVAFSSALWR